MLQVQESDDHDDVTLDVDSTQPDSTNVIDITWQSKLQRTIKPNFG